ncbi:hypothetical protein AKJ16_DCAP01048 [Drosera capensis]
MPIATMVMNQEPWILRTKKIFRSTRNMKLTILDASWQSTSPERIFMELVMAMGGAVFEFEVVLGGETFKASRRPSVQSYAEPSQYFMGDYSNIGSDLPVETSLAVSNGKKQAKASS